jgi:hypothetical protein
MSTPLETGSLARTTVAFSEEYYNYPAGMEFEIEDYASAEEADEPYGYYLGHNNGGFNNVDVREDHVELVKSAAEMHSRTIPTPAELAAHLASESLGGFGDRVDLDESDASAKDGTFEVYGTKDGLRFAAIVKVLQVERTDF